MIVRQIYLEELNLKQLFGYYLCPALFATFISGVLAVYMSDKFIFYTGVHTSVFQYFGIAFVLFFGIYFLYFIVTFFITIFNKYFHFW